MIILEASDIPGAWGPICPWELLLFNTPNLSPREATRFFRNQQMKGRL